MNALILSDIHGCLEALVEVRKREGTGFDAILAAGDFRGFSSDRTDEIFSALESFGCPVLYVLGNWDEPLRGRSFGGHCHHVHIQGVNIKGFHIAGLDFVSSDEDRHLLAVNVASAGAENCIVISHDRLPRVSEDMAGVPLFIFGHRHRYQCTASRGSTFLNPGALGDKITVSTTGYPVAPLSKLRNAIVASYALLSIDPERRISVEQRAFRQDIAGCVPTDDMKFPAAPLLEAPFVDWQPSGQRPSRSAS